MKCKITSYRKTLFIGWLCLLIFAVNHMAQAKLKIYYMPTGKWERNLWRMDANGNNKELFLESPVPMDNPRLSPDGKQILFTLPPWRKGELMVINLDGTGLRKLLANPPRPVNTDAEWSPDGKRTIVRGAVEENGMEGLFLGDAPARNLVRLNDEANLGGAQWLPDNEHIVGTSGLEQHDDVVDVVVVNVDTQEVQRLTDDGQSIFVFWHDSALAVEPAGKLSTSWGAIKSEVIDDKK